MENNFNNSDFEQFVKQNADQYRMFPSEKVWRNIHHTLHTRRRWYGLGLVVLLLTAGIVTWVMLTPSLRSNNLSYKTPAISQKTSPEQKTNSAPVLIAAEKPVDNKTDFVTTTENLQKNLFIPSSENILTGANVFEQASLIPALVDNNEPATISNHTVRAELENKHVTIQHRPAIAKMKVDPPVSESMTVQTPQAFLIKNTEPRVPDTNPEARQEDSYPLTIESVINSYKRPRTGKKMSWEVFITPTISYRRLSENKAFINSTQVNSNTYNYTSVADINTLVTHRPDMGLQLGVNAGYPISKSLKIVGGLQFNVSKYDIKASFSSGEVATIALNVGPGSNSVSTISNYRNTNSSKADWLRNLYFSASVPVGVELTLGRRNKTPIGVRATIQPTYILSDRAFLLSTDYKNYVEVPSLTRRWNMNTGFEVFAGFTTGKINWRVGPQARYQLKSSFKSKYPVNEHLFDFGLKVGMMLKN